MKVKDGDAAIIKTPEGSITQIAKLSDKLQPGAVCIDSHWWYPEKGTKEPSPGEVWEANANLLRLDDEPNNNFQGDSALNTLLCRVHKA